MSDGARKRKPVVLSEPMVVLQVGDPWQQVFPREAALKNIWMAYMLNEERRFMFHDSRRRWADSENTLVYPIEYNANACKDICLCYLNRNRRSDECQSMSISVRKGTRLKRFVSLVTTRRLSAVIRSRTMSAVNRLGRFLVRVSDS